MALILTYVVKIMNDLQKILGGGYCSLKKLLTKKFEKYIN